VARHREDEQELVAERSWENPYPTNSQFAERISANLDATKNMGYPAREEGRYGSHASYDGFDDESDS
jgi:hypothetical protein